MTRIIVITSAWFTLTFACAHWYGAREELDSVGAAANAVALSKPAPHIHEVTVGTLAPTERRHVSFEIRNESRDIWEIGEVVTSCGCLSGKVESHYVAPGERLKGSAEVVAKAAARTSRYMSRLEIEVGETRPPVLVVFRGTIVPSVTFVPKSIALRVADFDEATTTLKLQVHARAPMQGAPTLVHPAPDWLVDVEATPTPGIPLRQRDSEHSGSDHTWWEITLTIDLDAITRDVTGHLAFKIHTDDPTATAFVPFDLTALPAGPTAFPSQFYFERVHVDSVATARVLVTLPGDATDKVAGVPKVELSPLLTRCATVDLKRLGPQRYLALLTLKPTMAGRLRDKVVFSVPHNGHRVSFAIPVVAEAVASGSKANK